MVLCKCSSRRAHHRWFLHPPAMGGVVGGIEGIWLTMPPLELSEEMMVTDYTTNITKMLAPELKQWSKCRRDIIQILKSCTLWVETVIKSETFPGIILAPCKYTVSLLYGPSKGQRQWEAFQVLLWLRPNFTPFHRFTDHILQPRPNNHDWTTYKTRHFPGGRGKTLLAPI